ncbi:hypothetical protein D3C85_1537210 [compost metagenome]
MHFGDVDDKWRALLSCGGEQGAQKVRVEHVKRAERVVMLTGVFQPGGERN